MRDLSIPAIPTLYAGVLFRSRTEARWALFWDRLGIKWEYEPQGFVAAGVPYLPDFVVFPALGTLWVEIKPSWKADIDGVAKWRKFADRRPHPERSRTALLSGVPAIEGEYMVVGGTDFQENPVKGPWDDDTQQWRPCGSGHHFDLCYPGYFHTRVAEDGCEDMVDSPGEDRLRKAIASARSARFDGSDSGTVA